MFSWRLGLIFALHIQILISERKMRSCVHPHVLTQKVLNGFRLDLVFRNLQKNCEGNLIEIDVGKT